MGEWSHVRSPIDDARGGLDCLSNRTLEGELLTDLSVGVSGWLGVDSGDEVFGPIWPAFQHGADIGDRRTSSGQ